MRPSHLAASLGMFMVIASAIHSGATPNLRAQAPQDFSETLRAAMEKYRPAGAGSPQLAAVEAECKKVIDALSSQPNLAGPQLQQLLTAYELRARVRVANGDHELAKEDFRSMLLRQPDYVVGMLTSDGAGKPSFQAEGVFGEVQKANIGRLSLTVSPVDAEVTSTVSLPTNRSGGLPVALPIGSYSLTGTKAMYAATETNFDIKPGELTQVNLVLPRVQSAIGVVTVPAGAEVSLDNQRKGVARAVEIPQRYARAPEVASLPAGAGFLEITEVPNGKPTLRFTLACYEEQEIPFQISAPGDYPLPVRLNDASVRLKITGTGGTVYIDNVRQGPVEFTGKLCRGPEKRVIEVRSGARGRQIMRVDPNRDIEFPADPKPAIALLTQTGIEGNVPTDFRLRVEESLQEARVQGITVFAIPRDVARKEMDSEGLQPGWLSRAESDAGRHLNSTALVRVSKNLSAKLEVQGVAEINFPDFAADARKVQLTYLAAGSGVRETIEFSLDDSPGIRSALGKINKTPRVMRPSSGLVTADVESVAGAVVLRQAWNLTKGVTLSPGDVIVTANGQNVANATAFEHLVAQRKAGDVLELRVKGSKGEIPVQLTIMEAPVAVWYDDETLPVNKMLVDFRLAAVEAPPQHQMITRLNFAIVLMKAKNWADALDELERIQLPDLPAGAQGISPGTVQYYRGVCLDELGQTADADRAYTVAIQSQGAWLREGTLVEPLAKAKLADKSRKR